MVGEAKVDINSSATGEIGADAYTKRSASNRDRMRKCQEEGHCLFINRE